MLVRKVSGIDDLSIRYVTKSDIARFGGTKARQHALSAEGWLGQEWLAKYVDFHRRHQPRLMNPTKAIR